MLLNENAQKRMQIFFFMLSLVGKSVSELGQVRYTKKGNPRFGNIVLCSRGGERYFLFDTKTGNIAAGYDGERFLTGKAVKRFFAICNTKDRLASNRIEMRIL